MYEEEWKYWNVFNELCIKLILTNFPLNQDFFKIYLIKKDYTSTLYIHALTPYTMYPKLKYTFSKSIKQK